MPAGDVQVRMDALIAPHLRPLAEQPRRRGRADGRHPAVADQLAADVVVDRHVVDVVGVFFRNLTRFAGERVGHAFVGIDLQHPRTGRGGDAGVAPVALAFPGASDDPVGKFFGDLLGAVGAAVEHNDDLVGEFQAFQAGAEPRLLVPGDDERRQPGPGRSWTAAHAAFSAARRHRSRAAFSTASTVRLSIRVPVSRWLKLGGKISSKDFCARAAAHSGPHGA